MAKKTRSLDWLTIGEAAEYLGVSRDTLRRWEKRGKIRCYRTPGGRRRYTMYDLELAMKPQKTTPLITHQMPRQKTSPKPSPEPILERSEKTEDAEQTRTPETAPKTTQPTKRFSTLTTLVLIVILTLFVLLAASGVEKVLLPYLKSSKEILNPTPKTYSP